MAVIRKTPEDLLIMREAGRINAQILQAMREAVRPGVSTKALDDIAVGHPAQARRQACFSGLSAGQSLPVPGHDHGVDQQRVGARHSQRRIVSCRMAISSAWTVARFTTVLWVTRRLRWASAPSRTKRSGCLQVTEEALYQGIDVARAGNLTSDVSKTIQEFVESHGYGVVREYTGHGVGRAMHEDPQVPNWWPSGRQRKRAWRGVRLEPGITFALEPMVSQGRPE